MIWIFIIPLLAGGCFLSNIAQIQEVGYKNDPARIPKGQAAQEMYIALGFATQDCPLFYSSGLSMPMNWGMMLNDTTDSSNTSDSSDVNHDCREDMTPGFVGPCMDAHYIKKSDLAVCHLAIQSIKTACDNVRSSGVNQNSTENEIVRAHFAAYPVCAVAFNSKMFLPMFFF